MNLSEVFAEGGQVTILGLLVVFVCLILIIVLVNILSVILKDRKKKEKAKPETKIEKVLEQPLPQAPVVEVQDDELLAVLSAAVAAYMAPQKPGLIVRSYRRIGGEPAWAKASRNAQIYNKF